MFLQLFLCKFHIFNLLSIKKVTEMIWVRTLTKLLHLGMLIKYGNLILHSPIEKSRRVTKTMSKDCQRTIPSQTTVLGTPVQFLVNINREAAKRMIKRKRQKNIEETDVGARWAGLNILETADLLGFPHFAISMFSDEMSYDCSSSIMIVVSDFGVNKIKTAQVGERRIKHQSLPECFCL